MTNNKVRQSNFELLRIISMLMIVGLHYFNGGMGGAMSEQTPNELNYYITYLLESLFIVGVNTFILITGYFQISKSSIKISKALELLIIMVFYGAVFYTVALIVGWTTFSLKGMISEVIPILAGYKWFIKFYIVLYLLIPFINKGLNAMKKIEYEKFLILSIIIFSVYPSFLPSSPVTDRGYGIITFILMYSIGGYIKKYDVSEKSKWFYLGGYLLTATITFVFAVMSPIIMPSYIEVVWGYNFLFNVFGSVLLFLFFSKLQIQSNLINYIAKFSLGVYFVHTSPVTYDFLYGKILKTQDYWHSPLFLLHAIASIILVYTLGTCIDIVRKYIFDLIAKWTVPFFEKNMSFLFKPFP